MELVAEGEAAAAGWCVGCQKNGKAVAQVRVPFRSMSRSPNSYWLELCGGCHDRLRRAPDLVPDNGAVNTTWPALLRALS